MMRTILSAIVIIVLALCALTAQTVKIATYNISFLDEGISAERKANLQAVLKQLDADMIAFQEIKNPAALENILSADYRIAMIDDSAEVQELALAVRPPSKVISVQYVYPDKYYDFEFPRSRDLLRVEVEIYGQDFTFLIHHAKSRSGGRYNNDTQREGAAKLIVEHIRTGLAGKNVVLLGDFNDNPDDRSLNILEYGDVNAPAGMEDGEDTFLYNASEKLLETDYASYGYNYIYPDTATENFDPVVKGAREENNKWRGKQDYNFWEDVKIKAILFDQILLSMNLKPYVSGAGVFNYTVAIKGDISKIRFDNDHLIYTHRGSLASDHVPVWITLQLPEGP